MSEIAISSAQIEQAVGVYNEAAQHSGINTAEFDRDAVPSPSYSEVAAAYHCDDRYSYFDVPLDDAGYLGNYPGLRVVVGAYVRSRNGANKEVFFPGIVLPDQTRPGDWYTPTTLGFLKAGPDAMLDATTLIERTGKPLADIQHTLLEQLYGMHKPGTGEHGAYSAANVADAAHGSLIVITGENSVAGLHDRVHSFMAGGLAPSVAATNALDIAVGHQVRPVRESTMPVAAATRIIVAREHQLPAYRGTARLGAGELAVGVTLAAVRSKKSQQYPQPNLAAGMAEVLR